MMFILGTIAFIIGELLGLNGYPLGWILFGFGLFFTVYGWSRYPLIFPRLLKRQALIESTG